MRKAELENPAPTTPPSGGIPIGIVLVGVVGAAAAIYIGYKYYKSKS